MGKIIEKENIEKSKEKNLESAKNKNKCLL